MCEDVAQLYGKLRLIHVAIATHPLGQIFKMLLRFVQLCQESDPRDWMFFGVNHGVLRPNA